MAIIPAGRAFLTAGRDYHSHFSFPKRLFKKSCASLLSLSLEGRGEGEGAFHARRERSLTGTTVGLWDLGRF